jgi:hypothetical protein
VMRSRRHQQAGRCVKYLRDLRDDRCAIVLVTIEEPQNQIVFDHPA